MLIFTFCAQCVSEMKSSDPSKPSTTIMFGFKLRIQSTDFAWQVRLIPKDCWCTVGKA